MARRAPGGQEGQRRGRHRQASERFVETHGCIDSGNGQSVPRVPTSAAEKILLAVSTRHRSRAFFGRGEFVDDFDAEFDTCGAAPTALPTSCSATGASPRTSPRRHWRAPRCAGRRSRRTPSRGWCEWPETSRSTGCASGSAPRGVPAEDVPGVDAQRVDLQRALLALSPKQREVVILRYLVDLPEAEVAETLGCSVGTVKTHASRGLAAMRKSLEVTT